MFEQSVFSLEDNLIYSKWYSSFCFNRWLFECHTIIYSWLRLFVNAFSQDFSLSKRSAKICPFILSPCFLQELKLLKILFIFPSKQSRNRNTPFQLKESRNFSILSASHGCRSGLRSFILHLPIEPLFCLISPLQEIDQAYNTSRCHTSQLTVWSFSSGVE